MKSASCRSRLRHGSVTVGLAFALALTLSIGCARDEGKPARAEGAALAASSAPNNKPGDFGKLEHIVVIYLENHSFDNLYGEFPGANGLSSASGHARQVDRSGTAYSVL